MFNSNVYDYVNVLDKAADAAWLRQQVLSHNLANDDTPGYKRKDVNFEGALKQALENNRYVSMDDKIAHISMDQLSVKAYTEDVGFSYRLDKNNVDFDTENAEIASNYIRYQAIKKSIEEEFNNMKLVMK